jgi:sarcosine oxidase
MRIAVVGAGIVGLAGTYELLRRGHEVHCYEAALPMAARSAGDSRIFRLAHATPDLVERAMRAREGWAAWSGAAGEQLVGTEGTVVSGDIEAIATAMRAAGAAYQVADKAPRLPAADPVGPFLTDPAGGAIRAAAAGRYLRSVVGQRLRLEAVTAVEESGAVSTTGGSGRYDQVLIAAGAGTPALAATAGITIRHVAEHHTRCTFPLRDPSAVPPCWLDRSSAWRPGFTSYGHLAGEGRWAVGGHLPPEQTAWEQGHEAVTARSREVLIAYVADHVTGARPEVLDILHCDPIQGAGDGVDTARSGRVLAVWGNNLFKLAPRLAQELAEQLTS